RAPVAVAARTGGVYALPLSDDGMARTYLSGERQRRGAERLSARAGRGPALPGPGPCGSGGGAQWLAPRRDERGRPAVCVGGALRHGGRCPPVGPLAPSPGVLWAPSLWPPALGVLEMPGPGS